MATPIGNLGDFSGRAKSVLSGVDTVLAEDTRVTGRLLHLAGISGPRLLSLFEHNEQARIAQVISLLEQGKSLALVSSAGTPLMSDPGYLVVRACRQAGFAVSPVPGPSAPVAALAASGLPPYPYTFLGFLPRKSGEKKRLFTAFAALRTTLVFFERASRLPGTLDIAAGVLGRREICVAREVTKRHETFHCTVLGPDMDLPEKLLGELTVIIAPDDKEVREATSEEEAIRIVRQEAGRGGKAKEIVDRCAGQVRGWGKKALYDLYLRHVS